MRVFYWTLRALLSHWRRHPVQFFSVLTGLWLATALLTGVQALNSQARDSYARASQLIGGEPQASLSAPDGASFPQTLFAELRRAGWPVSPVVQGRVTIMTRRQFGGSLIESRSCAAVFTADLESAVSWGVLQ